MTTLEKLYFKNGWLFVMATSHLLSIGVNKTVQITNEQIQALEGNGLITAEFEQDLVRTTREIAVTIQNDPIELIQFCMAKEVFNKGKYEEEGIDNEDVG